jgi:hypothetical protein
MDFSISCSELETLASFIFLLDSLIGFLFLHGLCRFFLSCLLTVLTFAHVTSPYLFSYRKILVKYIPQPDQHDILQYPNIHEASQLFSRKLLHRIIYLFCRARCHLAPVLSKKIYSVNRFVDLHALAARDGHWSFSRHSTHQ